MNNKTTSSVMLILIVTQMVYFSTMIPEIELESNCYSPPVTKDNINYGLTETDLDRAEYRLNNYPNGGMEYWENPYIPSYISTSGSYEEYVWYETDDPIKNGSQSLGMETRATSEYRPTTLDVCQHIQHSLSNPINLTLTFDWWVDALPFPIDADHFKVRIRMGTKELHYYLGCQTSLTNTSSTTYFEIDGSYQSWIVFNRNLTKDYIESFSQNPTYFNTLYFDLRSTTHSYSRIFLDDCNLINGSNTIIGGTTKNGNFESTADWVLSSKDPVYYSRCTTRHEGDWSLNTTVTSNGEEASGSFIAPIQKRLTSLNKDQFSFWWRIEEWQNSSSSTFAYLFVSGKNETNDFEIYYIICHGGDTAPDLEEENTIILFADNFNTTNEWVFFNCSIWNIVTSSIQTTELFIDEISFHFESKEPSSLLTVLVDDIAFVSSGLGDMSYEDQLDVGTPIRSWSSFSYGEDTDFNVTDFACTGTKAANLTLSGNSYYMGDHFLGYHPFNSETELFLDLNIYIDKFNSTAEQYLWIEINLDDAIFAYLLANGSDFTEYESIENIILKDLPPLGTWSNIHLNLIQDYESLYNSAPNTVLNSINLVGSTNSPDIMMMYFDDFYLYEDPAPSLTDVIQTPSDPEVGESVTISATVTDLTLDSVIFWYRVDSEAWTNVSMDLITGETYRATIPAQGWNTFVEYYINATDEFKKSTTAPDEPSYYSYTVTDTIAPSIVFSAPDNDSIVRNTVDINVTAADSGSGVASVNVSIDGISLLNDTSSQFSLDWDTTTVKNGLHTILVIATDAAGNSAQNTLLVTVSNPATLDPLILLIILAILVGGAVIIVMIIKQRK